MCCNNFKQCYISNYQADNCLVIKELPFTVYTCVDIDVDARAMFLFFQRFRQNLLYQTHSQINIIILYISSIKFYGARDNF